jgi:ribosomal protein S18 acetylase RimI-like enzyme
VNAFDIRLLDAGDDLDRFGRIVHHSYVALADMPPDPDYEAELADVAGRVRDGVVFGAFVDGEPAGCVTFVADASSPHAEHLRPGESSFRMLGVDPAAQGRGIGEALTRRCIDEAAAVGADAVFIHSGTWMLAAHRLYRRLGFEFVPDRNWPIDPQCLLLALRTTTSRRSRRVSASATSDDEPGKDPDLP